MCLFIKYLFNSPTGNENGTFHSELFLNLENIVGGGRAHYSKIRKYSLDLKNEET